MMIGRVVGTVVATVKDEAYEGRKLLLVQPLLPGGAPYGEPVVAADSVDAGPGERVLVVLEGRAARQVLEDEDAPADAAIVGVVDSVHLLPEKTGA